MSELKNILVDLDGTIIDPKEGIINSIIYSLDKMGLEEKDTEQLIKFIGPPLIDSYMKYYNLNIDEATKAVSFYREYYSEKGIYQNRLYDNVKEMLSSLKQLEYNLFIATSKPTFFAEKIIDFYGINHLFEEVVGSNLDNTRKDKFEIIEFILNKYNLEKSQTVMIGDTKFDIVGAKKNKIKSIGVAYGYGTQHELESEGAEFIIGNIKELNTLILKLS